jgi:CMD domain protein
MWDEQAASRLLADCGAIDDERGPIMSETEPDVIDLLAGIEKGSRLDRVRAQRQQARDNAQKSYQALLAPKLLGGVAAEERYAVAAFVAGLHREARVLAFYMDGLAAQNASQGISEAVKAEIMRGAADGPYGRYPRGPLTVEDKAGPVHQISEANRRILGARLSAALQHAHLLVFHPRDASPAALQSLLDAGWSTTDVVTLSQLVAFLSFQIRVIAGLRVLAAASVGRA